MKVVSLCLVLLLAVTANAQWHTFKGVDRFTEDDDPTTNIPVCHTSGGCGAETVNADSAREDFKAFAASKSYTVGLDTFDDATTDGTGFANTFSICGLGGSSTFTPLSCGVGNLQDRSVTLDATFSTGYFLSGGSSTNGLQPEATGPSGIDPIIPSPGHSDFSLFNVYGSLPGGRALSIDFTRPVDGFGFYVRDAASTGRNITITCVNGVSDTIPLDSLLAEGSVVGGDGSKSDVVFFGASHENVCDPGMRCVRVQFSQTDNEDLFGFDELYVADSLTCDGSSISGFVYRDDNGNGVKNAAEGGIPGVEIVLEDSTGATVTTTTDVNGFYIFTGLTVGETYKVKETQPAGLVDGDESLGQFQGGSISDNDEFTFTALNGADGINYNFGERPEDTSSCPSPKTFCYTSTSFTVSTSSFAGTDNAALGFRPADCEP